MKTSQIRFLFILFISINLNAQSTAFQWAKGMGGPSIDDGNSMTIDASGNIYTTGNFDSSADFDPGIASFSLNPIGANDVFISKLNASGNFVWAKSIGGISEDYGYSINTDLWGNVFIIGRFSGTVDFDPGAGVYNLTSSGPDDMFILSLNTLGNFIWAKKIGGSGGGSFALSLKINSSGELFICGYFGGTIDFNPGAAVYNLTSVGSDDSFICKLDGNGNFKWAKSFGGTGDDLAYSLSLDVPGSIYIAGQFDSPVDFDPGASTFNLSPTGNIDMYVLKLDQNGNFLWVKKTGGTICVRGTSIINDVSGNICMSGYFNGTADFDPGIGTFTLSSKGLDDIYIMKLSSTGNFLWAKSMGSNSWDRPIAIAVDNQSNVYSTGFFSDTVDFDPGAPAYNLSSAGADDTYVVKLDASGNFVWANTIGGLASDGGTSIIVGADNVIYLAGMFGDIVDFDPGSSTFNLTSSGSSDVFICKLGQTPAGILENKFENKINLFPNPSKGIVNIVTDNNEMFELIIFSEEGNIVYKGYTNNKEINLEGLAKGLYLLQLKDKENKTVSKKIVIE